MSTPGPSAPESTTPSPPWAIAALGQHSGPTSPGTFQFPLPSCLHYRDEQSPPIPSPFLANELEWKSGGEGATPPTPTKEKNRGKNFSTLCLPPSSFSLGHMPETGGFSSHVGSMRQQGEDWDPRKRVRKVKQGSLVASTHTYMRTHTYAQSRYAQRHAHADVLTRTHRHTHTHMQADLLGSCPLVPNLLRILETSLHLHKWEECTPTQRSPLQSWLVLS